MNPKLKVSLLFAFVPWANYWSPQAPILTDGSSIQILVGTKDCKKGVPFKAAVVTTSKSQEKGLGGREKQLDSNEAMLFFFTQEQKVEAWMKDTLIPLGAIFFDHNGKTVAQYQMEVESDPTNPKKIFSSQKPVTAMLEISPQTYKTLPRGPNYLCIDRVLP